MRNVSLTLCFLTTFSGIALAQTEHELLFAHFGDGESGGGRIISQFILLNPHKTLEAQATITIRDDDGKPLGGMDLNGQILSNGTLDVTIPASGMSVLTTDGEGPVTVGSATVISDKPLTGIINFSGAFGAAGVGASVRQPGFVAAMIRNATTNTGFAIMNPGTTDVTVDLQLIDKEGNLLAKANETIPTMGHLARFFSDIPWQPEPGVTLDLSAFEGLIKGTTSPGQQIAATVIQTRPNQFITMPVGSLTQVGASELLFAHFGDGESGGGRIISQFILLNPHKTLEAQATITIRDDDGKPLGGMDLNGQILSNGTLDVTIPASGMSVLTTDGEGPVTVGSATVISDKPLTGIINFSGAFGAAGVGASVRQSGFVAAMIRNATTNTGFAIMNPGSTDVNVSVDLQLIDQDGNLLAKAAVTIPMMGHLARFFNDIPWQPEPGVTLDLSAFEGLIKGTTSPGQQIAATVIQTQTSEFVTMPVGPLPPVTITVTSAANGGPGSLRRALLDVNPGDIITFDPNVFPSNNPTTITLTSGLPEISQGSLTIDASNAGVILDGSEMTDPELRYGLHILSNSNTIRGLQIVGFPEAGITLEQGASHNLIGGDRGIGTGPLGQGNLISGNGSFGIALLDEGASFNTIQGNYIGINLDGTETWGHTRDGINCGSANYNLIRDNVIGGNESAGINLSFVADGHNTVTANIIGTDASGETPLANQWGVLVEHTSHNVIGPGNLIAHNRQTGITFWEDTPYNTVTQNSIRDNGDERSPNRLGGQGVNVTGASDARKASPLIFEFDLQAGSVTGLACANCIVEIFSDSSDQGGIYEGQTVAGGTGFFTFSKGAAFTGPRLTTNATDPNGSTTEFSRHTQAASGILSIQEDNAFAKLRLQTKPSGELADSGISLKFGELWALDDELRVSLLEEVTTLGVKRYETIYHEVEPPINWSSGSEFFISALADGLIDDLAAHGIAVNYELLFWDKDGHAMGKELSTPRFKTEEQVQDFLEYIRFIVRHFKGRVQSYTLWSEPGQCGDIQIKCVEALDYINLARQAIPVIRQEDPQAKVVLAPVVLYFGRDWLFTVLNSDLVQLFDVIAWHPFYGAAPDIEFFGNYYYDYPSIIGNIKETASANGFQGEYWGHDIGWWITGDPNKPDDQPWESHTEPQARKYLARVTIMHLGLDLGVGVDGMLSLERSFYPIMRNLTTAMAGTSPISLAVKIESEETNIMSFGFMLPNGDRLFALWTDDAAVDDDPGTGSTLTFSGLSAQRVVGIDVLNSFEQELITETENSNLVIRNLLVKDYPIILRLIR
ncbi:right-handed parallel beta-helix repeat-containing protein [Acidobacteria bacterium AH-259-A15]|nr:right-handed parallel beta-helix repeat-containing protein [Acidobacteria bacterium AH-259-A15]